MNPLMEEIACNAAHYAVDNWAKGLGKGEQVAMWKRYYDSVLAALLTFEEATSSSAPRTRISFSEN